MSNLKQSSKDSSRKRVLKRSKEQKPSKPFPSAEFVHDTSDEDSEQSSSDSERSPLVSKEKFPALKTKIEAPNTSAKPKPAKPIEKTPQKQKPKGPSPSVSSSIDSRNGDEERSGSDTDSESGNETGDSNESIARAPKPQRPAFQQSPPAAPPLPTYRPPPGFETASIPSSTSSDLADLFSPSKVQKKQIWHITVPSSIPISSIKEVASQSVQKGTSILSYKGAEYGLLREAEGENAKETLLLPFAESNDYRSANIKIATTLHLQQIVRLPDLSHRQADLPNDTVKSPITCRKPVRQQPEGLKMRYRPFGDPESSSPESSDEVPKFRTPSIIASRKKNNDDKTNDQTLTRQELSLKPDALIFETHYSSYKRKHDKTNNGKHEDRESTVMPKKRKHEKPSNSGELLAKSNKQIKIAANAQTTSNPKKPQNDTSVARKSATEKAQENQSNTEAAPSTEPQQPQQPKSDRPKPKGAKSSPKQTESEIPKHRHETPKNEPPPTTTHNKPGRSNEEKRKRKEEHRRRKEARESKIRDQENQLHGGIPGCEQPTPQAPNA